MSKLRVASLAGIATALVACRWYGFDPSTNRYVAADEVVGRWVLSAETLALAVRDGYEPPAGATHEIVFRADGALQANSVFPRVGTAGYVHGPGTWKLEHDTVQPRQKNLLTLDLPHSATHLKFMEEHGQLLLWEYWGDPDSLEFVKYSKQP